LRKPRLYQRCNAEEEEEEEEEEDDDDITEIVHAGYLGTFVIHFYINSHMPDSNG